MSAGKNFAENAKKGSKQVFGESEGSGEETSSKRKYTIDA
jgi:hypothetical protein